jgi:hypothetical protein|tara:strand:- start:1253 stop:1477 length:225 start_codon:yes stop_codon:yes gene_type:complete
MQSNILKIGDLVMPKDRSLLGVGIVTGIALIKIGEEEEQSIMETTNILWSDASEMLSHRTWSSANLIVVQSSRY